MGRCIYWQFQSTPPSLAETGNRVIIDSDNLFQSTPPSLAETIGAQIMEPLTIFQSTPPSLAETAPPFFKIM